MFSEVNLAESPDAYPVFEYRTQVREHHLDTFGHVNNAQYLVLYEEARWEAFAWRGYGMRTIQQSKIGTTTLGCHLRFRRELHLGEWIQIFMQVESRDGLLVKLRQWILKENGKLGSEARFTMGCFNLSTRKLISPTSDWLTAVTGINR